MEASAQARVRTGRFGQVKGIALPVELRTAWPASPQILWAPPQTGIPRMCLFLPREADGSTHKFWVSRHHFQSSPGILALNHQHGP